MLYLLKFGGAFCLLYFGTLAVIGLSSPENSYSPFVARYLNFIDPLRTSLLECTKWFLSLFGYSLLYWDKYTLGLSTGEAVRMVYSCIGYGVMSFWAAFVIANTGSFKRKLAWVLLGWAALYLINVLRVALLLLALHKRWSMPLGWDHHTWFNIFAYALIFGLIYLYDKTSKQSVFETGVGLNKPIQTTS